MSATTEDIMRWRSQGRDDILEKVLDATIIQDPNSKEEYVVFNLWKDSETGEEAKQCPFLKQVSETVYHCGIHDTKPFVCRKFPEDVEMMIIHACQMLEESDVIEYVRNKRKQNTSSQISSKQV